MADAKKNSSLLRFLLLFLLLYVGTQLVFGVFFPQKNEQSAPAAGMRLTAASKKFTIGSHPVLRLQNIPASAESHGLGAWFQSKFCSLKSHISATPSQRECAAIAVTYGGETVRLADRCPQPPVDIFLVEHAGQPDETRTPVTSSAIAVPCVPPAEVAPGETADIPLGPWKYSLFERVAVFEARLPGAKITGSGSEIGRGVARFSVVEPGLFTKAFRTFISAPFLNFLIFAASLTPGHNLGVAIIVLTLLVKLLLFFPTQHALEGQKKMQLLQPKLEALKQKYGNDAKRIQEETMKLWKEHKINPFQSCLPMLIQFPILIGLFYVIRDGSHIELSQHLVYGTYQNLPWNFGTSFLGLDLLKPNIAVMPLLLVAMQFLQMKLTFSIQKRKKKKEQVIDVGEKKEVSPQDMQQKMMLYALPLMIGFFAIQFPSAVSLYWGVSTLFAIGQQIIVNREHLRV